VLYVGESPEVRLGKFMVGRECTRVSQGLTPFSEARLVYRKGRTGAPALPFDLDRWGREIDYRDAFANSVRILLNPRTRKLYLRAVVVLSFTELYRVDPRKLARAGLPINTILSDLSPAARAELGGRAPALVAAVMTHAGPGLVIRHGRRVKIERIRWLNYETVEGRAAEVRGAAFGLVTLPWWPGVKP
jgi:hypothetical protein